MRRYWRWPVNWRIGRISQRLPPRLGWCLRCETTWRFVEHHTTAYHENGKGCFPLCETCWRDLGTPEDRLPYYRAMWDNWHQWEPHPEPEEWALIERAVLAGG